MERKRVVVLGCTGSIGKQTVDILRSFPERFETLALAAGTSIELLDRQIEELHPRYAGLTGMVDAAAKGLAKHASSICFDPSVLTDYAALPEADLVVIGVSGIAALPPLLAALYAGKTVALANKESIVCGHGLVDEALQTPGARILPVDSEQSAIFQCLEQGSQRDAELKSVILTASGGPFWRLSRAELEKITPEQASHHPVWQMGRKITVDSATLFNKGLEVMEAGYLFHLQKDQISVLIHPQSIVHSMVEYNDGAVLAQLSSPDMRLAIQYAMTYPRRMPSLCKPLSFSEVGTLTFHSIKEIPFRSVELAYDAYAEGSVLPVVYNGANEAAVAMFLSGRIGFCDIEAAVSHAMDRCAGAGRVSSLEEILALDALARNAAENWAKEAGK